MTHDDKTQSDPGAMRDDWIKRATVKFRACGESVQFFEISRHKAALRFYDKTGKSINDNFKPASCMERVTYMLNDGTDYGKLWSEAKGDGRKEAVQLAIERLAKKSEQMIEKQRAK